MSFLGFGTSKTKNKNKHPLEKTKKNLEKKRKTSVETENIVSGRKVVFWFYLIFFRFFCFLGRVFGFLVLEVKKSKKTHGKSTYHFTYVFLVFQNVLV